MIAVNVALREFAREHGACPPACKRCGQTEETGLAWHYGYDNGDDADYVGFQCLACGNIQGLSRAEIEAAANSQ